MERDKIQTRIGSLILGLATAGLVNVLIDRLLVKQWDVGRLIGDVSFWMLASSLFFFSFATFRKTRTGKAFLALGVFVMGGLLVLTNGSTDYFGVATVIVGILLLYRFEFLASGLRWKTPLVAFWLIGCVFVSDRLKVGVSLNVSLNIVLFLIINLAMLYILFEEEIRELVAANKVKDAEIAEKAAEIARLEPLSVLGERVAHVAHSFKNNLNQVSTALFLLEQLHDEARAAEKLREFSHTLNERIENILMVSRAGVDLEPEVFDVARVLEGMHQVYLQERTFLERVKTKLSLEGPVLVHAVRWDFILMVENILKNALEAIVDSKGTGLIRIDLARGQLTIANDGGAIPLCAHCADDCTNCQRYGRPGQTTKAGGSGHGLAQVMTTCRNNGWNLRIRTHDEWSIFEVRFPKALEPTAYDGLVRSLEV